jgi:hypothetical protein
MRIVARRLRGPVRARYAAVAIARVAGRPITALSLPFFQ